MHVFGEIWIKKAFAGLAKILTTLYAMTFRNRAKWKKKSERTLSENKLIVQAGVVTQWVGGRQCPKCQFMIK